MASLYERLSSAQPYVIAEMSANHAGNLQTALKLVEAVAKSGADCLKVQTFTADTMTIDSTKPYFKPQGKLWQDYSLYDLYQEAAMPWEWQAEIKAKCESNGLDFLSTPFDCSAVDFLESIDVEMYKIASYELVDLPLISYAASKGKPMILSCGMSTLDEINEAVETCIKQGNSQIVLLKCCSQYPADYANMNLKVIPDMRDRFGLPVGLSDHSIGSLASVVATTLGAVVIEKHVCLSREIPNPDAAFSMEPAEFTSLVEDVHNAYVALGDLDYTLSESEKKSRISRRSLFAIKDIKIGDVFNESNVRAIRPGQGLKPKYLGQILGSVAKRNIERGEPLTQADLQG